MHILTVVPILKGVSKDTLTYFSSQKIEKGSIVKISVRKKTIYGLVTDIKDAIESKSEIKSLSYNIKKIQSSHNKKILSSDFIKAVEQIADYNACSFGSALNALVPKTILENNKDILEPKEDSENNNSFFEIALLQADNEERYTTYRSLIREEFARNHSLFLCVPSIEDLNYAQKSLEKGIENYTYILHNYLSKKEIIEVWNKILKEDHPVLIIGTGSFISIPKENIHTIILEKESSRSYKIQSRPFLDIRNSVETIAKKTNKRLILGDTFLRIETLYEGHSGLYNELSPIKYRSLSSAECDLVQMKSPENQKKKEFPIISDELNKLLQRAKENSELTFLFCGRKGLYPSTVCSDCGTIVSCKNCGSPVVLYKNNPTKEDNKNLFVCHQCGERRDANELCSYCGGWRLNPLGIGIEKVVETIEANFPETPIYILDKDHITTHKQAVKVRDSFYSNPGSVLIGTEMALNYLHQKIENSAVVSIDSLFSIPDFRINEKVFHILLTMRAVSHKNFLVQTRQTNIKIFENAIKGNLIDFYREEKEERKIANYPPFATYIKITLEGEKTTVKKQMDKIVEDMRPHKVLPFEAFSPGSIKRYTTHGLIVMDKGSWIDYDLLSKLKNLPPYVMIKIDPDSLL